MPGNYSFVLPIKQDMCLKSLLLHRCPLNFPLLTYTISHILDFAGMAPTCGLGQFVCLSIIFPTNWQVDSEV